MKKQINVTKAFLPPYEEYCDEIKSIWENHWLTNMGEKHNRLEIELRNKLKNDYVSLFTNGHLALEAIIEAFEFPVGSEIITTPFTFASTTHAIVRKGLVPIFCDINDIDFTIDTEKLLGLITKKTVAIIPVHVYGNICDVHKIDLIAKTYNLRVIYDAAHAFGTKIDHKSVSEFGDASMFSFHATKVFHTIEGGAVAHNDFEINKRLTDIKNFGIRSAEDVVFAGGNAKMSEFQAAMGIVNLRYLDEQIQKRKIIYDIYNDQLKNIDGIILPHIQKNVESNYSYYPIIIDNYKLSRDDLYEKLKQNNVVARKYFYPLTNSFLCYPNTSHLTPVANKISKSVLTLPFYADLSIEEVTEICNLVKS